MCASWHNTWSDTSVRRRSRSGWLMRSAKKQHGWFRGSQGDGDQARHARERRYDDDGRGDASGKALTIRFRMFMICSHSGSAAGVAYASRFQRTHETSRRRGSTRSQPGWSPRAPSRRPPRFSMEYRRADRHRIAVCDRARLRRSRHSLTSYRQRHPWETARMSIEFLVFAAPVFMVVAVVCMVLSMWLESARNAARRVEAGRMIFDFSCSCADLHVSVFRHLSVPVADERAERRKAR